MVRLIAVDMDGTLLNEKKEMPSSIFPLLDQLRELGVTLAAASGRQYYTLQTMFPGYENEMSFICENGGLVYHKGKCIYVDEIPPEWQRAPIRAVREMEGVHMVLCGADSTYVEDTDPEFLQKMDLSYARYEVVDDLEKLAAEDKICKLSVFDGIDAETNCYPRLLSFADHFGVTLSGKNWVDLANPYVNKGAAFSLLQKACGVGPGECMAFGDYLNDREMMQNCYYSYAMANAHPDLKALCRFETLSNEQEGVIHAIKGYFGL